MCTTELRDIFATTQLNNVVLGIHLDEEEVMKFQQQCNSCSNAHGIQTRQTREDISRQTCQINVVAKIAAHRIKIYVNFRRRDVLIMGIFRRCAVNSHVKIYSIKHSDTTVEQNN